MAPVWETEYRDFVAARLTQLGRYAFLLCHDSHRAEDAVQKALTKLYIRWTRVRSPDAYVRRTIATVVYDEKKRHWFWRERPCGELPEQVSVDPAEAGTDRITMLDLLARLPARQRLAVVLRHWEDRSVAETAEIMRCSEGTVKSQTARGLGTLRAQLAERIPADDKGAVS